MNNAHQLYYAIIPLLLAATVAANAQTAAERVPQIHVNGTAVLYLTPDELTLQIILLHDNPKAKAAVEEYGTMRDSLLSTLRAFSVGDTNITESGMHFSKVTERDYNSGKVTEEFYRARTTVSITLRNMETYPELIVNLSNIPGISIGSVQYGSSKAVETRHKARLEAVAAARKKAEEMAAVYGATLGKVLLIEENTSTYSGGNINFAANTIGDFGIRGGRTDAASLIVADDAIQISASVYVEFELK